MHLHNIDGVNIPFDKDWNSIAISVSGGADSALLAYLICSIAPDNFHIHIVSHTRMWKTRPWQQYDSLNVFQYLVHTFPTLTFERHTSFIAPDLEYGNIGPSLTDEYGKKVSGDNIQQRAFAEYICYHRNVDAYYNAVTHNPRLGLFNGMHERDVEPSDENKHLEYMIHMGKVASHPFRFVDKSWVIKQYRRLEIEDLLDITRSCEGEFDSIDYKTYKPQQLVPICGECFWCKEREWAINENKQPRPE
jgi:hypothetical protein